MEDNIPDDNSLSDKNNDTEETEDEVSENLLKKAREEENKKTGKKKETKKLVSTAATRITAKPVTIISRQWITDPRNDAQIFWRADRKPDMPERVKYRELFMLQLGKIFAQKQDWLIVQKLSEELFEQFFFAKL